METSHIASKPKLLNFSLEGDLNPQPLDYMPNALRSEPSGHVDYHKFNYYLYFPVCA